VADLRINGYPVPDDKALEIVARLERRHDPERTAWRVAGGIRGALEWRFPVWVYAADLSVLHDVVYAWLAASSQYVVGEKVVSLLEGLRSELELEAREQHAS
jgi:hypothetical protein